MRIFARGGEHALDVPIERSQHSNVRMHQRPPIFHRHDQGLGRGLPFLGPGAMVAGSVTLLRIDAIRDRCHLTNYVSA
jgi:hypothetical protein